MWRVGMLLCECGGQRKLIGVSSSHVWLAGIKLRFLDCAVSPFNHGAILPARFVLFLWR